MKPSKSTDLFAFLMALRDPNPSVREHGAIALGNAGEAAAEAVPALIAALDDEDEDVRRWSIWALGRIGRAAQIATAAVQRFQEDDKEAIRELARETIDLINGFHKPGTWRV